MLHLEHNIATPAQYYNSILCYPETCSKKDLCHTVGLEDMFLTIMIYPVNNLSYNAFLNAGCVHGRQSVDRWCEMMDCRWTTDCPTNIAWQVMTDEQRKKHYFLYGYHVYVPTASTGYTAAGPATLTLWLSAAVRAG